MIAKSIADPRSSRSPPALRRTVRRSSSRVSSFTFAASSPAPDNRAATSTSFTARCIVCRSIRLLTLRPK